MTSVLGFIKGAYSSLPEINGATLSGAIDVLVIQHEDGSLRSSPWYLRIGKYKVLRNPRDRVIKITVNEQLMDFEMKLSSTGDAYFCEATDEKPAEEDMTSPPLSPHTPPSGELPDGLQLNPALDDPDSRTTSPDPNEAQQSASATFSWWGAGWRSEKFKDASAAEDQEDMDVEDMLRLQIENDQHMVLDGSGRSTPNKEDGAVHGGDDADVEKEGGKSTNGVFIEDGSTAVTRAAESGTAIGKDGEGTRASDPNGELSAGVPAAESPSDMRASTGEPQRHTGSLSQGSHEKEWKSAGKAEGEDLVLAGRPEREHRISFRLGESHGTEGMPGALCASPILSPQQPMREVLGTAYAEEDEEEKEGVEVGGDGRATGGGDEAEDEGASGGGMTRVTSWRFDHEDEPVTPSASLPVSAKLLSALLNWAEPLAAKPSPPQVAVATEFGGGTEDGDTGGAGQGVEGINNPIIGFGLILHGWRGGCPGLSSSATVDLRARPGIDRA